MYLHYDICYNFYCASQDFRNLHRDFTEIYIFMHRVVIPHLFSQYAKLLWRLCLIGHKL